MRHRIQQASVDTFEEDFDEDEDTLGEENFDEKALEEYGDAIIPEWEFYSYAAQSFSKVIG